MAFPGLPHPDTLPIHVVFPEAYERTKRMIVADFLFIGGWIVGSIVGVAYFFG